jgi:hypothetical protein
VSDDFIENGYDAVHLIRGINHPAVSFLPREKITEYLSAHP